MKGAQERGVSETVANEIFQLIVMFAGYGFNKCVVGGQTVIDACRDASRPPSESLFEATADRLRRSCSR